MIIEYNMIIMIMIVKAVIKKHTCKMLLKELFTVSPPHTDRRSQVSGCDGQGVYINSTYNLSLIIGSCSHLLDIHYGKDMDAAIFFHIYCMFFAQSRVKLITTGLKVSQNRKRKPQCFFDMVKDINSTGFSFFIVSKCYFYFTTYIHFY